MLYPNSSSPSPPLSLGMWHVFLNPTTDSTVSTPGDQIVVTKECRRYQSVCVSQCHREGQVTFLTLLPTHHWVLFRPHHHGCCRLPQSTHGKLWVSVAHSPPSAPTFFSHRFLLSSLLSRCRVSLQFSQSRTFLVLCPDVIMDMFQAPTLLEDPFNKTSAFPSSEVEAEQAPLKHGDDTPSCLSAEIKAAFHFICSACRCTNRHF